jgi:tocopherol cyclase
MLEKYKPNSIRGTFERSKFFEGWFQKVYSKAHKASFILIYGYATHNSDDEFGFLQILIPNQTPEIVYFPKNQVSCDIKKHQIRMGKNLLTTELIRIDINGISIELNLKNKQPFRTFKNSMGYTYFIPNLPCYHSVLNTAQSVSGEIKHQGQCYTLDHEMGYLEKNWGTTFPESYFWVHAVDPNNPAISLLFSRAKIVWLGKTYIKHVGYLCYDGQQIELRELKNCAVSNSNISPENRIIQIRSASAQLDLALGYGREVQFKGPKDGALSRMIHHQADAKVEVSLTYENRKHQFQMVGNFEDIGLF